MPTRKRLIGDLNAKCYDDPTDVFETILALQPTVHSVGFHNPGVFEMITRMPWKVTGSRMPSISCFIFNDLKNRKIVFPVAEAFKMKSAIPLPFLTQTSKTPLT